MASITEPTEKNDFQVQITSSSFITSLDSPTKEHESSTTNFVTNTQNSASIPFL